MRAVQRSAPPPDLDGPGSVGGREQARAIAFYGDEANREESFDFAAYSRQSVKLALEALFHQKCAYCESDYGATAPVDVEHYRPKGAFLLPDNSLSKPGYYWLAAEWTNLLPSCIDCNRERYQQIDDTRGLSGKANQFPLADETRRATQPGQENLEEPLLLDPTRDDPDSHLEFVDEAVRPALVGGIESERGATTIRVLGLGRFGLSRRRATHLTTVDVAIRHFREAVQRLDVDPDNPDLQADVEREMVELKRLLSDTAEYAAMIRHRIRSSLPEIVDL